MHLSPERSAGINHERMAGALGLSSHRKLTGYVSQPKSLRAIFPFFCELSGLVKMVQEVGPTLEWDNSMSRPFLGQGQKILTSAMATCHGTCEGGLDGTLIKVFP